MKQEINYKSRYNSAFWGYKCPFAGKKKQDVLEMNILIINSDGDVQWALLFLVTLAHRIAHWNYAIIWTIWWHPKKRMPVNQRFAGIWSGLIVILVEVRGVELILYVVVIQSLTIPNFNMLTRSLTAFPSANPKNKYSRECAGPKGLFQNRKLSENIQIDFMYNFLYNRVTGMVQ
jgi:hypothetical protein